MLIATQSWNFVFVDWISSITPPLSTGLGMIQTKSLTDTYAACLEFVPHSSQNSCANSPRPQRGQARSDLFSKASLFPSPNPLPNQNFAGPPPPPTPPHPCRLAQNPLKCSGFVGVQLQKMWTRKSLKKCFLVLKSMTCLRLGSGPAQPATRLLATAPSLSETHPASPAQPRPTRPAPSSQPTSKLSPACQGRFVWRV